MSGPVVLEIKPRLTKMGPVRGNQASYLFFPVFLAFVCVILTNLSTPIIGGLSVLEIDTHGNGTVSFGAWGWCATGVPDMADQCSPHRAFGNDMLPEFANIPQILQPLADVATSLPGSYVVGSAVLHIFAAVVAWMTAVWTLAAAAYWAAKQVEAYDWTRWAFAGTFWSSIIILIAWTLDLASIARVHATKFVGFEVQPSVKPGPAIWLMMLALLISLSCFITRVVYLKYKPRPVWTIKGAESDFHNNFHRHMPNEAALEPEIAFEEKSLAPGYAL